ncbi:MAG: tetratricopeptide repeat protein [Planctomycetaceae bacterium]
MSRWPLRLGLLVLLATFSALEAADIEEARQLQLRGNSDEAIAIAAAEIEAGVYGDAWHLLKAEAELTRGRYDDAIATIDAGLEKYAWSVKLRLRKRQVLPYLGRADEVDELVAEVARLVEASPWRYTDGESLVMLGEMLLGMGADAKEVQTAYLLRARRNNPAHRLPRLALGRLALEKRDFALAAETFEEAIKTFPDDPDLLFGLSEAITATDPERASELRARVEELNPRHVPLLLSVADQQVAREEYDAAAETLNRVLAVNGTDPEALARRAVLAHLRGEAEAEAEHRAEALALWATNPAVDHLIGRELSKKYRFREGAAAQRRALEFDAGYRPAMRQLGQDMLRLGQEAEGWKLLDAAYQSDPYDVTVYNLLTLRDSLEQFTTFERDGLIVRMEAHEAEVYGELVLQLLLEARVILGEKYGYTPDDTVLVELFPSPADFEVRTFGLPGVAGYLAVCFGDVITANSPASQSTSPSNWESTLWHEFAHVVTLHLTRNRMPRWFSEGISVYEERQRNPVCGEQMNRTYQEFIRGGELTPIGELSGAFLSPKTPQHIAFAYYESSLVVEYLIEQHGFDAILEILADLGAGLTMNEALERRAAPLAVLEPEFEAFARRKADEFIPQVDWSPLQVEATAGDARARIQQFVATHPDHYLAHKALAELLVDARADAEAEPVLRRAIELYPSATGRDAPRYQLAELLKRAGRIDEELSTLRELASLDAEAPWAYLRLIELAQARGDWARVGQSARQLLAVDPLLPQGHRALAESSAALGDAATELRAWS